MFYIKHVEREEAEGAIKKIYDSFPEALGLPGPVLVKTIIPDLAGLNAQELGFFNTHKTISIPVFAAIRYILSVRINSAYCTTFNGKMLMGAGLQAADLEAMAKNAGDAPFSPRENALIQFAVDAVEDPESIGEAQMVEIRAYGWSDEELLTAVVNGADLVSGVNVFKAFQKKTMTR